MDTDRLYGDLDLAQFYDIENGWGDDFEYCKNLIADRQSVLDLGCGTGLFAATVAQEGQRLVVGVDPAGPMLEIARQRPGGQHVRWIQDDARRLRLNERFDLIVMTGHAFQVFLTADDQRAVLRTIQHHLAPAGRFAFDTRNPAVEAWKTWTPAASQRTIEHPRLGQVMAWNDVSADPATGVVTYGSYYKVAADGRTFSSRSRIAFPLQEHVALMIGDAGLMVEAWLGDWSGAAYEATTPEIIAIGRLG
jgi:ubiquinone/menaquinone biosynthesis C-methylase UbiE